MNLRLNENRGSPLVIHHSQAFEKIRKNLNTLPILVCYSSVEPVVGFNKVFFLVLFFSFVVYFVLVFVLVFVLPFYVLLTFLLLLLLPLSQRPREGEGRRMGGKGIGNIVRGGVRWGSFRGWGLRCGVRGWENGSGGVPGLNLPLARVKVKI